MRLFWQSGSLYATRLCSKVSFPVTRYDILHADHVNRYAPFIYGAWHNPETLKIVSDIAGVELVPNMDFEVGHINISVKSEKQAAEERQSTHQRAPNGKPWEDDSPIVGWHNDSYPFVCVTMLSDCEGMIGGETALRMANGEVMRVRGPRMVSTSSLPHP